MPDSASKPELTGLAAITDALEKRNKILTMQNATKAEEKRRTEGKHGFLYRERPPEENPFEEDETKRHNRLMNCADAWN